MSGTTEPPAGFEIGDGYAIHRPEGNVSLEQALELAGRAIVHCRENGIRRLLIDGTKLTGLGPLGTAERFTVGERLASDARAAVKVAIVVSGELIDPAQFAVTVARNRGLFTKGFSSESEAWKWLLDPNAE